MGVFTRFRDIINSNINAMLDEAEEPEKMIKMMIREIEDTLVELKASCAGVMAGRKKIERQLDEVRTREKDWADKARLAVEKGRDDLAREALLEKRKYTVKADVLEGEIAEHSSLVEQYQDDIRQLEDKLGKAREKRRMLVQRHIRAKRKKRVQEDIRRVDSAQSVLRFDELENRIERMEAEAELVNFGKKTALDDEFDKLSLDDEIEKELQAMKSPLAKKNEE